MIQRVSRAPTFRGNLRLPDYKDESLIDHFIYKARPPAFVYLSLEQDGPCRLEPLVKPGEKVLLGQKIAEPIDQNGAALHASVSGRVEAIRPYPHPFLGVCPAIEIANDGADRKDPSCAPVAFTGKPSVEELIQIIRTFGLVTLDGAAASLEQKIIGAYEEKAHTLIVNAVESEPFLTALHALLVSEGHEVLRGFGLLRDALNIQKVIVAGDDRKQEALEVLGSKMYGLDLENVVLKRLPARYPQEITEVLVRTFTGKQLAPNEDPARHGVLVVHAAVCHALSEAVFQGKPFYERVITVAGQAVAKSKNMRVRIGAPMESVLAESGGMLRPPRRIILGGTMRGAAQATFESPVTKQTAAVLALVEEAAKPPVPWPCIRCEACQDHCPVDLLPSVITLAAEQDAFEIARTFSVEQCIECGNCTYVCPSERPMADLIRYAKYGVSRL